MNTEIVTPQQARQIARRLFLKLYPDQEDWFDLAWGCYARLGVQTESGVKLANLPGLGAVAGTDPLTENTINYFVSFANAFLIEHPIALGRYLNGIQKKVKVYLRQYPIQIFPTLQQEFYQRDHNHRPSHWHLEAKTNVKRGKHHKIKKALKSGRMILEV